MKLNKSNATIKSDLEASIKKLSTGEISIYDVFSFLENEMKTVKFRLRIDRSNADRMSDIASIDKLIAAMKECREPNKLHHIFREDGSYCVAALLYKALNDAGEAEYALVDPTFEFVRDENTQFVSIRFEKSKEEISLFAPIYAFRFSISSNFGDVELASEIRDMFNKECFNLFENNVEYVAALDITDTGVSMDRLDRGVTVSGYTNNSEPFKINSSMETIPYSSIEYETWKEGREAAEGDEK